MCKKGNWGEYVYRGKMQNLPAHTPWHNAGDQSQSPRWTVNSSGTTGHSEAEFKLPLSSWNRPAEKCAAGRCQSHPGPLILSEADRGRRHWGWVSGSCHDQWSPNTRCLVVASLCNWGALSTSENFGEDKIQLCVQSFWYTRCIVGHCDICYSVSVLCVGKFHLFTGHLQGETHNSNKWYEKAAWDCDFFKGYPPFTGFFIWQCLQAFLEKFTSLTEPKAKMPNISKQI